MDKNLLLAVALSFLVYIGWFAYVQKTAPKNPPPAPAASAAGAASPRVGDAPAPPLGAAPKERKLSAPKWRRALALEEGVATVDSRGCAVSSYRFQDPLGDVELVQSGAGLFSIGGPAPDFAPLPFEPLGASPKASSRPAGSFACQAILSNAVRIVETFIPGAPNRLPALSIGAFNSSSKPKVLPELTLSLGPGLGTITSARSTNEKELRALALSESPSGKPGKLLTLKPGENYDSHLKWAGLDNRYFLAAVLPDAARLGEVSSPAAYQVVVAFKSAEIPAGGSIKMTLPYYIGPKGYLALARFKAGLQRSVDFGYFSQLGRLALKALYELHRLTGNWGWAILALTVAIQMLLFPMTLKSLKAQNAMKRLQPEIAIIQKKYAKEPQKLQTEMMELYKKSGTNPMGGCLPMLVQIPVFYALYNVLRNSWELHGAPWIFWIRDLSDKDPYYALPIIMGILMFAQNKTAQKPPDPTQAKMMTWLPVVFTFMFLNLPSGLVLYWLTNSAASTAIQVGLKKKLEANF